MIELRDYQKTGVARIREEFARRSRRVLFILPTGGGKTIVFVYICSRVASKGKRVVILVHRVELIDQVSATLGRFGVDHGVIAAGHPEIDKPVQIASVATLARRLNRVRPFDLVIVDEAHHATAGTWAMIMAAMPDAFALGVSATPERLDGRGLGAAFDVMVEGPTAVELTMAGHLVPARVTSAVFFHPTRSSKMPFTTGVHIAAGYVQERQGAALLSLVTNSITSTASTGVTDFVGPSGLNPPAGAGSAAPAFEINATVDTFVAVGPTPDAVNGPRMLVRAGTDRPMFCKAGDRLAWAAA